MTSPESNPLVSQHKSSDGLHALLHPLVLLTISDYITRHNLRRLPGPVVGALLGRQNGREISLEHAFDTKLIVNDEGEVLLDRSWFDERLQQCQYRNSGGHHISFKLIRSPSRTYSQRCVQITTP